MELLHKHGAEINDIAADGNNSIHLASQKDFPHIVAYLAELGAPLSKQNDSGETPLHLAVYMNAYKTASLLLALQVRISVKDINGRTALHVAAKNNNGRMVRLLLLKGFDKNNKDINGSIPEELASDINIKGLFKASGFLEIYGCRPMLADGSKKNYLPFCTLCFLLLAVIIINSVFLESCNI